MSQNSPYMDPKFGSFEPESVPLRTYVNPTVANLMPVVGVVLLEWSLVASSRLQKPKTTSRLVDDEFVVETTREVCHEQE